MGGSILRVVASACPICDGSRSAAFSHRLLERHEVDYLSCPDCGFLQTEPPYWLDEAYSRPIASTDVGLVMRNLANARLTAKLLVFGLPHEGPFLDAGGGYGLFTRLMRDRGFDFYWSDPHTENLFASGHEDVPSNVPYGAVTAYEVLEHLPDPLTWIRDVLARAGSSTLIFSQELFSGPPPPKDWWYYSFETGQHISFYQSKTLDVIARRLGLSRWCGGNGRLHVLSSHPVKERPMRRASGRLAPLWEYRAMRARPSKLPDDYAQALRRIHSQPPAG